ncbi:MAG TPA: CARDB domain-containing protein [Candidatus Paceibacterota bacterium]|nr:CARDB domain-containing protein [Candidatus Paceibacterota bacterium]
MKNHYRILVLVFALPFLFLTHVSPAHAGTYTILNYSFPDIDHTGNTGLTLKDFISKKYLDALASDVYYNSLSGACTGVNGDGHCGYPTSCVGGACGGNAPYGNFDCRVDKGHSFYLSGGACQNGDHDAQYFKSGYPGQLMGNNDSFAANTALRACQVMVTADTGTTDSTVTASYTVGGDNGDDGSYRNNLSFMGSGWDIFEANHHYNQLSGNDRNSGNAISSLTCKSSAKPAQTLTINGGSSATVIAGEEATLAWSDNDNYAGAKQTCTASTDNTDKNGAFTIPVPDASNFPYPSCNGNQVDLVWGKANADDPGQTSTLITAPQNSKGDALYEYSCNNVTRAGPRSSAGCQNTTSECTGGYDDGGTCMGYTNTAWCPVAPPTGSVSVSANTPGTYHYNYNCTSLGGTTNTTVTLVVQTGGTLPDLTADTLTVAPSSPTVNVQATISAAFHNSNATSTGQPFSDAFQLDPPSDPDPNHSGYSSVSTSSPVLGAGESNTRSILYTFDQPGTWYVRACADSNNDIPESDETQNCTSWLGVSTSGSSASLSCSVETALPVNGGDPVKLKAHPSGFSGTLTYTWKTKGGGSCDPGSATCTATYDTAGTYQPTVEVSDGTNDLTATCSPDVTVRPVCSPASQTGTVPYKARWYASHGGTYEWYNADGSDTGQADSTYQPTYNTAGNYGVYVQSNGIQSTTCYANLQSCNSNPSGTLSASPDRVATNTASTLSWTGVQGVPASSLCQIISSPDIGTITAGTSGQDCTLSANGKSSPKVTTQTLFQLVCGGQNVDGASAVVDVAPSINEF